MVQTPFEIININKWFKNHLKYLNTFEIIKINKWFKNLLKYLNTYMVQNHWEYYKYEDVSKVI